MHPEAREFIANARRELSILEIGSFNVNGGIRDLFAGWDYLGIDLEAGPGVDIVADGATFETPKRFDVVASCEAFEHTENWREIVANAHRLLKPGGLFIGTAAGPGRAPHNCDGNPADGSEFYANVEPGELLSVLNAAGFREVVVDVAGNDVRWTARKPIPVEYPQYPHNEKAGAVNAPAV